MNDLHEALRQNAESAPLQPASLGTIKTRARGIRRRRAALSAGGTAVAVAVIAGLGFAIAPHGTNHAVPPISSTSTVPTQSTSTGSDVGQVFHVSTTVTDVGQTDGQAEQVPYWRDGELVAPSGAPVALKDRPLAIALGPDGSWWVVVEADSGRQLVHLSATGAPEGSPAASVEGGVAAAPGRLATIAMSNGRWVLTTNNETFDLGTNLDPHAHIDAFLANGDVAFSVGDTDERIAHLDTGRITKMDGAQFLRTSPSGQVAFVQGDGTWISEEADGTHDWTLTDWATVSGFSPDGKYVALFGDRTNLVPGSPEDLDEPGVTGTLWIRNAANNSPVAVFTAPKNGLFGPWTWEGDDLLALAFERDSAASANGTWTLVRLSPDGYKMVRSASWPGRIDTPPYVFGAGVTAAP